MIDILPKILSNEEGIGSNDSNFSCPSVSADIVDAKVEVNICLQASYYYDEAIVMVTKSAS